MKRKRHFGSRPFRFTGQAEVLDSRCVLAALVPAQAVEIAEFTVQPAPALTNRWELIDRATVLSNWTPVRASAASLKFDAVGDTVDIALLDITTRGIVQNGIAQSIGGSIRGIEPVPGGPMTVSSFDRPGILQQPMVVDQESNGPEPAEPITGTAGDRVALPDPIELLPTNLMLDGFASESNDGQSDTATPVPFVGTDDASEPLASVRPEASTDGSGELLSPSLSGLETRQSLELPVEPNGEVADTDANPPSEPQLGIDLVHLVRQAASDFEQPLAAAQAVLNPQDVDSRDREVSLQDPQQRPQFNAGRIRPTVQWQDTDTLADPSSDVTMRSVSQPQDVEPFVTWHDERTATVPGIKTAPAVQTSEFHLDQMRSQDSASRSWFEAYLAHLAAMKRWLNGVAIASSNQLGGAIVPAMLISIAFTRLLENERGGSVSSTPQPMPSRASNRRRG